MKSMKALKMFITKCLVFVSIGCHGQNSDEDVQAIAMLKEFYIAYNTEWATYTNHISLKKKLDSLKNKYCTLRLINKIKEPNLDHDVLVRDQGTDVEYLKTLTILKDSKRPNTYVVSWISHSTDPNSKREYKEPVTFNVALVKEKKSYKIDKVW